MKRFILSMALCTLSINFGFALTVTPSPSVTNCGSNSVTFTFDCPFNGSVIIDAPPAGVTFPGLMGPVFIETVTGGTITFDVYITGAAPTNYDLSFIILSSNLGCAVNNDSAAASMTSTCITPPNDNCVDAEVLTISNSSCSYGTYTTTNGSGSGTAPSCTSLGFHDLWYTFNANNSTVVMEFGSLPGSFGYYGLFDGCPASGGSQLDCSIIVPGSGTTNVTFSGLTVGDDYIIQMLFLSSEAGNDQTLCLHSATAAPSCATNTTIADAGPNLPNTSYTVSNDIITSGPCTIVGTGIVLDAGNSILLDAGFYSAGNNFEAIIGGCTP